MRGAGSSDPDPQTNGIYFWGQTAFKPRSLRSFISAIDSDPIERGSYLLVESIDRLSRDQILKSLNLFTSIPSKGINIVTLSDFEQRVLTCVSEVDLSLVLGSESSERVAALRRQLTADTAELADVEERLSRLIEVWEQGVHVSSVAERINKLEAEIQTLRDRCVLIESEYEIQGKALDPAESKQRRVIESDECYS